jgi:hypothetical protein
MLKAVLRPSSWRRASPPAPFPSTLEASPADVLPPMRPAVHARPNALRIRWGEEVLLEHGPRPMVD